MRWWCGLAGRRWFGRGGSLGGFLKTKFFVFFVCVVCAVGVSRFRFLSVSRFFVKVVAERESWRRSYCGRRASGVESLCGVGLVAEARCAAF